MAIKSQKIKININDRQKRKIRKLFAYRRFCYNRGVEYWKQMIEDYKYHQNNNDDNYNNWYPTSWKIRDLSKSVKKSWESKYSIHILDTACDDVEVAYKAIKTKNKRYSRKNKQTGDWENLGKLKFISKKNSKDTCRFYKKLDRTFGLDGNNLWLPGFMKTITETKGKRKPIKVRKQTRDWLKLCEKPKFTQEQIKSVTITCDNLGTYWVSVSYEANNISKNLSQPKRIVGIDLGIETFATLAYDSENQRTYEEVKGLKTQLKKINEQIDKINKKISIKELVGKINHSNHVLRLYRALNKLYQKSNNLKNDFLHKTTRQIVNRFGTICIEDLKPTNLVKNHKLARHINQASWGKFRELLEQKCSDSNRHLVIADRWFPSSQTCSCCGYIRNKHDNNKLRLDERKFICPQCGFDLDGISHSRDKNAAYNLKLYAERTQG